MAGNSTGPIVVGVDGSLAALHAVRWAAAEAAQRHRGLRLVHATDDVSVDYPRPAPTTADLHHVLRMRGQHLLRAARDAAVEAAPGLDPQLELSHSGAAATLVGESAAASLLVLATAGLRPLGRTFAGSVSISAVAHAHCPVALIRGHVAEESPPATGPVVVGVDGSPSSEEAIGVAFEEAAWRGTALVAVHAWDDSFLAEVFEEGRWKLDREAVEEHERELLAQRLAGWQEKYPDVPVERVVVAGRPAERLLDLADHAQLMVVGSRGRGGFAGMLLGSTSQAVMSYALCPVLVARHHR
ncbi:universal stress protein [Amycolatopsis rhizosphaerae]|uniref:Universal stress protein n=1 Tax=Amycolatopsis rhizosphaerae TaxID=2053003 RepID=A0A558ABJ5_9PSEU|nr:universal stress protein [Amycolatopsis rhizosphaerae]TVT21629.1 universal stress protein [Amycolatopsis rhizosphaerae]